MNALVWIGVACLGGVGAIGRFLLDRFVGSLRDVGFPVGTFAVNISGAFMLGLVTGLALTGNALILAGTTTIGAYTTFSTWMFETHRLREEAEFLGAFGNMIVSLLVGVGAAALGRLIGTRL